MNTAEILDLKPGDYVRHLLDKTETGLQMAEIPKEIDSIVHRSLNGDFISWRFKAGPGVTVGTQARAGDDCYELVPRPPIPAGETVKLKLGAGWMAHCWYVGEQWDGQHLVFVPEEARHVVTAPPTVAPWMGVGWSEIAWTDDQRLRRIRYHSEQACVAEKAAQEWNRLHASDEVDGLRVFKPNDFGPGNPHGATYRHAHRLLRMALNRDPDELEVGWETTPAWLSRTQRVDGDRPAFRAEGVTA